jgi:hypothetical protein
MSGKKAKCGGCRKKTRVPQAGFGAFLILAESKSRMSFDDLPSGAFIMEIPLPNAAPGYYAILRHGFFATAILKFRLWAGSVLEVIGPF